MGLLGCPCDNDACIAANYREHLEGVHVSAYSFELPRAAGRHTKVKGRP